MSKKIIFCAGGTGGHIFPAVNLMKHFFDLGYNVLLITDKRGNKFIKNHVEFRSYILNTFTPTNKNILKKITSYFLIFYSIIKSIIIIKKEKPNLIIGFGGYVSFPTCFASKFFKLPLVIYENNIIIGRANKHLLPYSKKMLIAKKIIKNYPEKFRSKIYEVGAVLNKDVINYLHKAKSKYEEKISILVLGGSQGAEVFGTIIPKAIKQLKDSGYNVEINQQCVLKQKDSLISFYNKNNIKNYIFVFEKKVSNLILSSNIAITRCGASTTSELAYTLTPFIGVPLANSIDNHQYLNIKYYVDQGCGWLLEQKNFNPENLLNLIIEIIKNKNKLETTSQYIKNTITRNVYQNIENEIKEFI
jgi:UDP-N-acetylglucosamine--N-acetylmuramyl-(pentapeptide) pyrophosphoryl-undecaprenol N-acetylglucosamine transferase